MKEKIKKFINDFLFGLGYARIDDLESIGYYKQKEVRDIKKQPFTLSEVESMYVDLLGEEVRMTEEESKRIFHDLSNVEGFIRYLDMTLINDKNRYFVSNEEKERNLVTGAFHRTVYLRNKINGHRQMKDTKIKNLRYGK